MNSFEGISWMESAVITFVFSLTDCTSHTEPDNLCLPFHPISDPLGIKLPPCIFMRASYLGHTGMSVLCTSCTTSDQIRTSNGRVEFGRAWLKKALCTGQENVRKDLRISSAKLSHNTRRPERWSNHRCCSLIDGCYWESCRGVAMADTALPQHQIFLPSLPILRYEQLKSNIWKGRSMILKARKAGSQKYIFRWRNG